MPRARNDTTVSVTKCCLKKLSALSDMERMSKSRVITTMVDELLIRYGFDPGDPELHACFEPVGGAELGHPLSDAEIDALLDDLAEAA